MNIPLNYIGKNMQKQLDSSITHLIFKDYAQIISQNINSFSVNVKYLNSSLTSKNRDL